MPEVLSALERAVLALRALYESYGYARFPMRRFEEYAFYLQNKSFLTSESVLSFTDANGRLMALKPDVTLSIVKQARTGAGQLQRLYYNESVYRLSPTDHEFTEIGQIGVEMLGDIDLCGACEVLGLAAKSLRILGVEYVLDISHMGFVAGLMAGAGLSGERQAQAMRLIQLKNAHELRALLASWGVREDYVQRIAALPDLSGGFDETLARARALAAGEAENQALDELADLYGALSTLGLSERVRLDVSILNDLDYYNGLMFQGYMQGAPRAVLSGGRYDGLMEKFSKPGGGLGFALYLDELGRVLLSPSDYDADALVLYAPGTDAAALLHAADGLRARGQRVFCAPEAPAGLRARQTLRFLGGTFEEVRGEC